MKSRYLEFEAYINTQGRSSVKQACVDLGINPQTYYRHLRTMRNKGVPIRRKFVSDYDIPKSISNRILPPPEYYYAHLAAYLCRFNSEELIPPYGKTAAEIMLDIRKKLSRDSNMAMELVFGLQNQLALYGLYTGEIEGFKGAVGKVQPPERYI